MNKFLAYAINPPMKQPRRGTDPELILCTSNATLYIWNRETEAWSTQQVGITDPEAEANTALPYKSYVALLTQTGEDAPVATVVYNTLSGTPTWDYQVGGAYRINLTGEFTVNKTVAFISGANASGLGYTFTIQYLSVDTIRILSNSDNWLTNTAIEIRVYP